MKSKISNKKLIIYSLIFVLFLAGSFAIYKVISALTEHAIISDITMTSIETGNNIDPEGEDNLVINCTNGSNCVNTYTPSKDSSKDNILVKSFDKIKYNFEFNIIDSDNNENDIEDATVNLKITLNGDDKKYVTFDKEKCSDDGICTIKNNSSFETTKYSVSLTVNNAPNGYEIHPTFSFDVVENNNDTPISLGYNTTSENNYYYSYTNNNYSIVGPSNYMPTIVSSKPENLSYTLYAEDNFNQSTVYNDLNGRFITYLLGIKTDGVLSGSYYGNDEISFKVDFNQDGHLDAVSDNNWIRLYTNNVVDGIRPISYKLPYSGSNEQSKNIKKPGTLNVTKENDKYTIKISNYDILLDNATLNADGTNVNGNYITTIALTNFSPRSEEDGNNIIHNNMNIYSMDDVQIDTASIQNVNEQLGTITQNEETDNTMDYLTTSSFYEDNEVNSLSLKDGGSGSVSKGTTVKYITRFKNNKTSSKKGLKEVIKFDTYAYRILPYDDLKDINITVKCGKSECSNISSNDFEVRFVGGSFNYKNGDTIQYVLNNAYDSRLSNNDRNTASNCLNINMSSLSNDQIMNLYGGPCIKGTNEATYNKLSDAVITNDDDNTEIPIGKIIVQTKKDVVIPDGAEVIIAVKARVKNVSDTSHNYQATTMITTSDYDTNLIYYAPQINDAISPNNYIKTYYRGNSVVDSNSNIGDSLKIVNYTLRQNITVTNTKSDGSVKTKYRTTENETITYKVETKVNDNNMEVGADDTWYIKNIYVNVFIPNTLVYIPDSGLIEPISVTTDNNGTYLRYQVVSPSDKTKPNMSIKDIYFKTKLVPTLSGRSTAITVTSNPECINVNNEVDTTLWSGRNAEFTIYGTGVSEVIGTQSIGTSGSIIEKNGTIDYVLNAYNNTGERVTDYSLLDILPYNNDENGSKFSGTYTVKITSNSVSLDKFKCTKEEPYKITRNDDSIWEECSNISNDFVEGITGIRVDNVSIDADAYMGEIIISLKTKDNKSSDSYNNRFLGYTRVSNDNISNIINASVVNRSISGVAFLDSSCKGIKNENSTYISNIPVTLYKVVDGELNKVGETVTNENGYYAFTNLSKGRYKIRTKYDTLKYDLALRYATEDTSLDSDAYQLDDEGTIEISDKSESSKGIVLYPPYNNITNMDIGLLPKQTFGFTMSKYITKIDLSYNGIIDTKNYENTSKVLINVKNSLKATAKVYYGISITNNSNKAGYINLVKEDIPEGFIFYEDYPENAGWFKTDDMLGNRSLENTVIYPNETVYLNIVLFMPAREEAGTFINTASVAEISEYKPIETVVNDEKYVNDDNYVVGDRIRYAGMDFHVIDAVPNGKEQILTLLADSNSISMNHLNNTSDVYKWSRSNINSYINGEWLNNHGINASSLIGFNICDDASGLFNENANGGVVESINCASNQYTVSKVRLLTQNEFNTLISNLTDTSFLLNNNFWLMDSVYASKVDGTYNEYGVLNNDYDTSNLVKYINVSNSSILPVQSNSGFNKNVNATTSLDVRPVIKISTHNIIFE